MNKCTVCSEVTLGHRCRGCGKIHCESHILPENHDCMALYFESTDGKWFNTKFETLGEDKHRERPATKSVDEINAASSESDEPTPDPDKKYTVAEANADNPNYQSRDRDREHPVDENEPTPDPNKKYTVAEANADNPNYETVDVSKDRVYRTAEPEYESSPDVNPDGSIKTNEPDKISESDDTVDARWLSNRQLVLVGVVGFCLLAYIFYLI